MMDKGKHIDFLNMFSVAAATPHLAKSANVVCIEQETTLFVTRAVEVGVHKNCERSYLEKSDSKKNSLL